MFTHLCQIGLKLHPEKSRVGCSEVSYLGHVVSAFGIRPKPEKVRAVEDFPFPLKERSQKQLLGLASYYHHFVPNFAKIAAPLYSVTKDNVAFTCTQVANKHLSSKRTDDCTTCTFIPFIWQSFCVAYWCKLSWSGSSSRDDGGFHLVAYDSYTLSKAEANYGVTSVGKVTLWKYLLLFTFVKWKM